MKSVRNILYLFCMIALLSCGKEDYFKSESGIKKQLEGSWELIPIPSTDPNQTWKFGTEQITRMTNGNSYVGNFTIETSLTDAEIKLDKLAVISGEFDYNGTWEIVRLDNEFLVIANDRNGTTGIKLLEFEKQ